MPTASPAVPPIATSPKLKGSDRAVCLQVYPMGWSDGSGMVRVGRLLCGRARIYDNRGLGADVEAMGWSITTTQLSTTEGALEERESEEVEEVEKKRQRTWWLT